jgi:transcriptional regulator with XRE-family HTH domain
MMKKVHYRFGEKLRLVRERKGLTLKEVARRVNVSESLISQIERNRVSPSIDTLMSIADTLEIDLEYLFQDYKKDKDVSIVRADERRQVVQNDVTIHELSMIPDKMEEYAIEAFLMEIKPGSEKGDLAYGHRGKELGIILDGQGELVYGTQTHLLKKGDSFSFPSDIPHTFKNTGKGVLRTIWITTPPRRYFT